VLSAQLKELEADGLIRKTSFPSVPPHTEYGVTDYGQSARPVLAALCAWGEAHQGSASSFAITSAESA
jgi:DNA-binding HxlR family transcriptional regulator